MTSMAPNKVEKMVDLISSLAHGDGETKPEMDDAVVKAQVIQLKDARLSARPGLSTRRSVGTSLQMPARDGSGLRKHAIGGTDNDMEEAKRRRVSRSAQRRLQEASSYGDLLDVAVMAPELWFPRKNHVEPRIGPEFQAIVPSFSPTQQLLWTEKDISGLQIWRATNLAGHSARTMRTTGFQDVLMTGFDRDSKLFTDGGIAPYELLELLRMAARGETSPSLTTMRALYGRGSLARGNYRAFDDRERALFNRGLFEFGKDFGQIRKEIFPERTTSELVEYYYCEYKQIWRQNGGFKYGEMSDKGTEAPSPHSLSATEMIDMLSAFARANQDGFPADRRLDVAVQRFREERSAMQQRNQVRNC